MSIQARRGVSTAADPRQAVEELADEICDPEAALTLFYCAPSYDLEAVAAAVRGRFGAAAPVIGCTTGAEVTPQGYREGSITGVSLRGDLVAHIERIPDLDAFTLASGEQVAERALAALTARGLTPSGRTCFGFLLIDGMSRQEDPVVSSIYSRLGDIQLIGGSAGDGVSFKQTFLYHRGELLTNCALFTLIHTTAPFHIFKTEHFLPTNEKMVITGADPTRRLVTEINGRAAATEYARMVGLEVDDLSPLVFATHPVVISVGNSVYVRSIQEVHQDGSLSFFCAIDEGLVLTVARSVDMVRNLEDAFAGVRKQIGDPEVVIGCDCILRYIEASQKGVRDQLGDILAANHVVGFATYGEQFNAMHLNQTFTAVALGRGARADRTAEG